VSKAEISAIRSKDRGGEVGDAPMGLRPLPLMRTP
jgi:hypothetical protein